MKKLTINARIATTIAFLGVLLIATGALGIVGMAESNRAQRNAYEVNFTSVVALGRSGTAMSRARFGLDWAMSNPHSPQLGEQLNRAKRLLGDSDKAWAEFRALPKTPELQRLTDDLDAKRTAVLRDGIEQLIQAIGSGDTNWMDESRANHLIGLYSAMNASQGSLEKYLDDAAQEAADRSTSTFRTLLTACVASIVVGLGVAFLSWRALRRAIMSPMRDALGQFDAIAAGELRTRVEIRSEDEMGTLLHGLASMQDKLGATIQTVRKGSDSIAAATQQIAAGNLDLSQRTEEQAASLEQTAAAMDELTSTVQLNAENAQHASRLAEDASSKMTGIITAIEGIAFQTNILALNAAVEAARAGEEGRGFAVVAGEVRSLAQRSAAAAKEIGGLIADSTARVAHGAQIATGAGDTIREIESSISRVAKIVGEIATASQQQSDGIKEVSLAVTQMDEVTQQNAALVEENAATAASLADEAQRLSVLTAAFRVEGVVG
ncbi:methyl-accepting chemotaxis protein [Paraburkholderia azotifigens]|uniref:methyl-accepting chemotaxis protein n=1 Tax=Paraburkholderia azotifigens TaxID=2057004 RepID=UPI00317C6CF5